MAAKHLIARNTCTGGNPIIVQPYPSNMAKAKKKPTLLITNDDHC
jgi:hypothetical protein